VAAVIRRIASSTLILFMLGVAEAGQDAREPVQFPPVMQEHLLSNMRDHLVALNDILSKMAAGDLEAAAQIAETRLGMSSLGSHGASHMAKFMPEGMQSAGTRMHRAASRFALKAQEGDARPAYQALSEVTAACVACHQAYRTR
jgi:cytochrome c556